MCVVLLTTREIRYLDVPEAEAAAFARLIAAIQKVAENRVAIEAGKTAPHDAALRVDKSTKAAVADNTKIKRGHETLVIVVEGGGWIKGGTTALWLQCTMTSERPRASVSDLAQAQRATMKRRVKGKSVVPSARCG